MAKSLGLVMFIMLTVMMFVVKTVLMVSNLEKNG